MQIGQFRDGSLVLSCGDDGAASDLVFAEGAMVGDPALEKQRLLLDRIVALEKDAKRYRFLRDGFSPMGLNIDGNHAWVYRCNATLKGLNLDAAIDAAMVSHPVWSAT